MRRTVPPSAEIEEQIDQLLAVGLPFSPASDTSAARAAIAASRELQERRRHHATRLLIVGSESARRAAGDACLRPESGGRECRAIRAEVRRLKVPAWASAAQVGCSQVRPLRRSPFGAPT